MPVDITYYATILMTYSEVIEMLIVVMAFVMLVSNLDDLFIDACYWIRKLYVTVKGDKQVRRVNLSSMLSITNLPIAIMVPAWHEYDVIYDMLKTNISLQRYQNYRFFVGTYPNDLETQNEVRRAVAEFPDKVTLVVTPEDGPTSKADCLNSVIAEIQSYEKEAKKRFAGIVLHDSEDVIHPFELLLFNYLLDRKHDFIQLPVYSFPRGLMQMVAGCYMDEFAEWHSKDLLVREKLTGVVPCAGTSACFSRLSIDMLVDEAKGSHEVFKRGSLTEDYDIAFRLRRLGRKQIFVRFPIKVDFEASDGFGRFLIFEQLLPIATREFFPDDLRSAYRQRARWLLGIVFQGWSQHGWQGTLGMKYFFVRDRKGILTAPTAIGAYFLAFNLIVLQLAGLLWPDDIKMSYATLASPWFSLLLLVNVSFLLNRAFQRSYFTTRIYGWKSGLMAIPRILVSNIVNFYAVLRAIRVYARHLSTGEPMGWDKTAHVFLSIDAVDMQFLPPIDIPNTEKISSVVEAPHPYI